MKILIPLFVVVLFVGVVTGAVIFYSSLQRSTSTTSEIEGKIIQTKGSPWTKEALPGSVGAALAKPYFYDANNGFAVTNTKSASTFYKTSDAGKTWQEVSTVNDYFVKDLKFTSVDEGYLVAIRIGQSESVGSDGSCIMKTEDGGKSWTPVYSSDKNVLEKIAFDSNGLGVAVGRIRTSEWFSINLVLLTRDKGQTWSDMSENVNKIALNSAGRIDDYLQDILFVENNKIVALSETRRVYSTKDQGATWTLDSQLSERAQTGVNSFGKLPDGRLWMGGGAVSIEGQWGMVSIQTRNSGWETYRLDGYYFSDVKFLSDKDVMACGAKIDPDNFGGNNESNRGVVLYSSNNGKDWLVIAESSSSSMFTTLSVLSDDKIFVTGTKGENLFLNRKQN